MIKFLKNSRFFFYGIIASIFITMFLNALVGNHPYLMFAIMGLLIFPLIFMFDRKMFE
ncbi:hypothetical protein PQE75_gp007 [Bacillus phage vB_BcoS-136]|uniref:Uncharacterized protein n=1 Tax=Bacillus phage vB_BcoS-136 TaxID=2419619 RepID=A0A3G3BV77_9CAUD|nr:hypothetical protein PQE75_gp007 [Bacillus phage vB_BcoS-136]AYP68139.1 hypothetical protein vBBcoS136_00007 [Bacillus phage vB_BcoS-136]